MTVQDKDIQWSMYRPIPGSTPLEESHPRGLSWLLPRPLGTNHKATGNKNQPDLNTCFHPKGRWQLLLWKPGLVLGQWVWGFLSQESVLLATPSRHSLGHSWDYSDGLMGPHSGLVFFQAVILTLRRSSLTSSRTSICSVAFLLSLFLYKNDNTLDGTIFCSRKPKWFNRYSSAGQSASGRAPW